MYNVGTRAASGLSYGDKQDMAIDSGDILEVSLGFELQGSRMFNIYHYVVNGAFPGATAEQIGQGWWNHVKDAYRGLCQASFGTVFSAVRVKQLVVAGGALGEYAIPSAERVGTRPNTAQPQVLPTYVATGVRLTVGTSVTRPGQKRIGFMTKGDQIDQEVEAGFYGGVENLFDTLTGTTILGAPVIGFDMSLIVASRGPGVTVPAWQLVTGYLVNQNVTSQVSRKLGRGM